MSQKRRSRGLAATTRTNAEDGSANVAYPAGPAQRGCGLTLGGVVAGVTRVDGEIGQEQQATPERPQHRMGGNELIQEKFQVVRLRDRLVQFLKQRLEVFLSRLLAVETHLVTKPVLTSLKFACGQVVVFGDSDFQPGRAFARALGGCGTDGAGQRFEIAADGDQALEARYAAQKRMASTRPDPSWMTLFTHSSRVTRSHTRPASTAYSRP